MYLIDVLQVTNLEVYLTIFKFLEIFNEFIKNNLIHKKNNIVYPKINKLTQNEEKNINIDHQNYS
jgi:hypothetical protein